jgi:RasGEF domain/RasGEF N-terminal motif
MFCLIHFFIGEHSDCYLAHVPASSVPRPHPESSEDLDVPNDGHDRPSSQQSKHSRDSSDYSMLKGFPSPLPTSSRASNTSSNNTLPRQSPSGRTNLHYQYTIPAAHTAPPLSLHPAFRAEVLQEASDSETESNMPFDPLSTSMQNTDRDLNSFLDMEESDADSAYRYSDDVPILQRNDDSFVDRPAKVAGFTFDGLVDRLLSQYMSKADSNFADIFLCLYRKFAAPGELFSAILGRLEHVAKDNSMHYLTRTGTQLRIITVVAKWVSSYPGDFASPQTRECLSNFIDQLSAEPAFAAAAQEMRNDLQYHVTEDDDTGWARTDADMDAVSNLENFLVTPSVRSNVKLSNEFTKTASNIQGAREIPEKRSRRPSEAGSNSSADAHSISEASPPAFHSVEEYEAEARKLVPSSTLPLTKFRYHICMDTSDDDFADEITRIDWIMFSSIRVRDLVRHVSLSLEQKEKCKSLANVNRMIDHFNHVAKWVSNMILMRDKAKHRAQMLEKFMRIALRLRQLNNYNGLAAVIAGINGSAVHRLAQTRALVPAECQKRFMRLELLMSTQKSHFAYRLAWDNSSLPRIPFIPLHRRDLVSAEEGSRTFVGPTGDRINWKKFEVLAEVILPIMRSQGTPYPNLEKHEIAQELILDCRMPTDEEVRLHTYQSSKVPC